MQMQFLEIEEDDRRVEEEAQRVKEEREQKLRELSQLARERYGTPDRSWCQPTKHTRVVGIDFGSRRVAVAVAGETVKQVRKVKTLTEVAGFLMAGDLVVGESSHLAAPRTKSTPSQLFTADELLAFYRECDAIGALLRILPHAHTPGMREWAAHKFPDIISKKKSDANDALAFAYYVKYCNAISNAKPQSSLTGKPMWRQFAAAVRLRSNLILNAARTDVGYEHLPVVGEVTPLVAERIPREDRWFSRHTSEEERGELHIPFISSVVATIVGEKDPYVDGTPVTFSAGGHAPGRDKHQQFVLRMTPYHTKAGVARSNIMFHRWRHALVDFAKHFNDSDLKVGGKLKRFAVLSPEEWLAKQASLSKLRAEIGEVYRLTHAVVGELGYERYDII